jgi:hypothetical protein
MRARARLFEVLIAVLTATRAVAACPCQGSSGASAGVTTSLERFGVSLTESARVVHGAWLSGGHYSPLAAGDRQWAWDVGAIAGFRPIPSLELGVESAFGHQALTSPEFSTEHTGVGDTTVRIRWDAKDEPMPFEGTFPWPALTVVASLRVPTASADRNAAASGFGGRTGSVGASGSSEGLGTFEPAFAVVLTRSATPAWQFTLFGEGAVRAPDSFLGIDRHLGPRGFAQFSARFAPTPLMGVGLMTDLGWEGDVAYEGVTSPSTSQRLWTVGAFGYLWPAPTGFRWGALVRYAPPVEDVGKNATRATIVSVSLGYAR